MSRQSSIHRLRAKTRRLPLRLEALEGRALLSSVSWVSSYQLPSGSDYNFAAAVNPTYAGLGAVPTQPAATVNASAVLEPVATNTLGVNLAWWDDKLTTPQTQQMVEAAGLTGFRFPGGSNSDDYHFDVSNNFDDPAANTISQFAQFIEGLAGIGLVTLDYGSGSPQEAAAELAYLEGSPSDSTVIGTGLEWNDSTNQWQQVDWQTVGYWASLRGATPLPQDDGYNFLRIDHPAAFSEIKYWEVGNEEYGSWEIDHHGTPGPGGVSTGAQHDPATYAAFARTFAGFAAEIDPGIRIGIDSDDPTGDSDNNWTNNVLTQGHTIGFVPGFISDHNYVEASGQESDSTLLLDTVSNPNSLLDWSTRYADYQALLQGILGSQASSVQVMATEFNSVSSNPGKQTTSLVNGLFIADSIGSLLGSGYTGGFVWDLRNGWDTDENNSPSLYGWRQGGDDGLLGDPNTSAPPSTGPYVPYPGYFAEQLASKIAQAGGLVVSTTSNVQNLTVYAVLEANGHLELLAINKDPDANINEQFNLQGFTPNGQAQVWQYGKAQDYAQSQTTDGAAALANYSTTLALSGSSFNYTFPAYSMTVLDLTPATPTGVTASATGGVEDVTPAILTGSTFSDANTAVPVSDFLVTAVNWGDGNTSTTGLSISGSGGSYTVTGSHRYTEEGAHDFTIVVKDVSNGAATITGTADVADAPLTATAANIASTEGETFTGTLATFGDGDLLAKDTDYSATINWGDGTSLTAVTGSQMAIANGTCTVAASHVYTEAGSYTATVTVNDIGGDTATVADTAVVTPAATAATGATVNGTVNAALSTTVATFTHGNNSLPAVDFSATIDWGDGEITAGTVTPVSGTYSVSGTHTYADSGTFTVATTIVESGVSTVADGSALVASSLTPNEQYVTAVYEDVLTRVPEPGGLKYWPNILDQAQANGSLLARLSSVAMQIGQSAEYYGNFVVTTAYEKYLGRAPDQAGLNYWVQQMRHGLTDQELEAGFAASDEFYADAGGTNIAWIDAVYKLVLGRSPDSGGERYWNNQLNSLLSTESTESARLQAALGISGSTENNTQLINADYEHYLGRAADPGGLQYWLNQFADGASNEDVIAGFTGSPEYYKNRTGISLS